MQLVVFFQHISAELIVNGAQTEHRFHSGP